MRAVKWLVVLAILLAGCGDETTVNNYYTVTNGAISGQISPLDPGTTVMTADGLKVTHVDANGNFILDSLLTGVYHIIVRPVHYSRREFMNVAVAEGQITSVGKVVLSSYPYPFWGSDPTDGADSVRVGGQINLYADESVVLADLRAMATVSPPVSGGWGVWPLATDVQTRVTYVFMPREDAMRVATSYRVRIPAGVRLTTGDSLGSELTFNFTIEPLRLQVVPFRPGLMGGVPIHEFAPVLWFNSRIEPDSLTHAVSFVPSIYGIWVEMYSSYSSAEYSFIATSGVPLQPESEYQMVVSDQVMLADGLRLTRPDTARFTTEPIGIVQSYPRNGWTWQCSWCGVDLTFNVPMDTISVREASSLRDIAADTLVPGVVTFSGILDEMRFLPQAELRRGAVYRYMLAHTAHAATGQALHEDFSTIFQVGGPL